MALTPHLELRQTQTLVMTPQLQQAIKLLQLSNIELAVYVEQELQRNPLLEREEGEGGDDGEREMADPADGDADPDGLDGSDSETLQSLDSAVADDSQLGGDDGLDVDYDNMWSSADANGDGAVGDGLSDSAFATAGSRGGDFDDSRFASEGALSGAVSLRDHLTSQLSMDIQDPVDRMIGVHLIDMLDESGYLAADLAAVADILDCDLERVERTLARLQQFDPPGIFARNLAECLALQLRDRNRFDPAMAALLDNLDLLARRDVAALVKVCGVDAEDIADMIAEIRSLDPKPALAFDDVVAQPVTPDVLVRPAPNSGWIVELNSESLPRVLVNNQYHARISRAVRSKADRQYVSECLQSANWLVKSLHQRATTILKVATEIVRQQETFLTRGVRHLRPLVLRDIAEAIEMHESTVSRVTSNKYMATPRGIYELKYFFNPAIASSSGGEAHAAESVRQRIKALIDAEPSDSVMSDDGIVEILNRDGIDIARRTVAKYREAMGIPSSVQRRREKAVRL